MITFTYYYIIFRMSYSVREMKNVPRHALKVKNVPISFMCHWIFSVFVIVICFGLPQGFMPNKFV